MHNDVKCPYCDRLQDINHEDGYGYGEDELHEQECIYCSKYFVYETTILYSYKAKKADCLNGSEHNMKAVEHFPNIFPNWVRCIDCGHEERGAMDLRHF